MIDSSEYVRDAVDEMVDLLRPAVGRDWSVRAGTLTWSCWSTAAHVGRDLLAYAGQLASQAPNGYLPFDLVVAAEATPADVLDVVAMPGSILATVVAVTPATSRAWHYGAADASGFAAMGVGETVLHTFDIAIGLGLECAPSPPLCAFVVERLFPEHPAGAPPDVLLWLTGRRSLSDQPPVREWVWKAAR
jgi:hypothetical protein